MILVQLFKYNLVKSAQIRVSSIGFIKYNRENRPLLNITSHNFDQKNYFSLKDTIESIVKTQAGIIKSISESTPVSYVQDFVVNFHSFTGLPWWASLICMTIFLRSCITFPFAIHQNYIMAKIENLKLEMPALVEELKKETTIAVKKFGWTEQQAKAVYYRSVLVF